MLFFMVILFCVTTIWGTEDECGVVNIDGTDVLIIGGSSAKRGEVPWHAGIYTKTTRPYKQICGGSIISNKIVISAAHCFWDEETLQLPAENYAVGVGKLYRPWNTNLTKEMHQQSDVKTIHIPDRYQGNEANHQEDIAIVEVTSPFQYTPFVRPVCVNFDVHLETRQLQPGNYGKVAGWGLTSENGPSSQVLKVVKLPFVDAKTCISESPYTFRPHITSDKFCAGSKDSDQAVCKGDSGGGMTFAEPANGQLRYYLRGVVSSAPTGDSLCNKNSFASFTHLLKHEHFIKLFWELEERVKNDEDECGPLPSTIATKKKGRKAWEKCKEYQEKLVFPCVRKAPSGQFGRADRCHHYSNLLFDGEAEAAANEFPHMALLLYEENLLTDLNNTSVCGGSLISDNFLLTAAHCTRTNDQGVVKYAVLGITQISDIKHDSNRFKIKQFFNHPEHKPPNRYNDIALVELEKRVYLDEFLVPACLHTGEEIDNSRVAATGWGIKFKDGPLSNNLKKMILTRYRDGECNEKHQPSRLLRNGLDPLSQSCYEKIPTSLDTCQGDSGGPLQVINTKIGCMHTVVGVTSFGRGCNIQGEPGVYTNVSRYLDWIENVVWP